VGQGSTNAEGVVELGVSRGHHELSISFDRSLYQIAERTVQFDDAHSQVSLDVGLQPAGRVELRVKSRSGEPLHDDFGAMAHRVDGPDGSCSVYEEGDVKVVDNLLPGSYNVSVYVKDYTTWHYPGTTRKERASPVTVTARKTTSIAIEVP